MSVQERLSFKPSVSGQTEFRAQVNHVRLIKLVNGQVVENSNSSAGGLSARTVENGLYGFSSIPEFSASAMDRVLTEARQNASRLKAHTPSRGNPLSWIKPLSSQRQDFSLRKKTWSTKEIVERLQKVDQQIQALGTHIKSRVVYMREQRFDKNIWTGVGGYTVSDYTRAHIYMRIGMDSPHGPIEMMGILGGCGPIEDTYPSDIKITEELNRINKWLMDKANGVHAESGKKTVVMDTKLAGILAHEAIGHTTEADLVMGGAIAGEYINQQVASPLFSLVDFAHSYKGELVPDPVFSDDEGVEAKDTVLIENGVLKTFMNSRETAERYGQAATGHARAWAFNDEPLIRMRNTAILPGKDRLEDMIASIDDGYYLIESANGQADSTSEFMFGVTCGYEIKNGKLGRGLLDTTISGVAFDMLKTVSMVSDQMTWNNSGTCGKKQPMHVSMGGPAIKCEINIGGR